MYQLQRQPDSTATLNNAVEIHPVATLRNEHGGVAHIFLDDGCYVLAVSAGMSEACKITAWWFREAWEASRTLPHSERHMNPAETVMVPGDEPVQVYECTSLVELALALALQNARLEGHRRTAIGSSTHLGFLDCASRAYYYLSHSRLADHRGPLPEMFQTASDRVALFSHSVRLQDEKMVSAVQGWLDGPSPTIDERTLIQELAKTDLPEWVQVALLREATAAGLLTT